MGKIKTILLSLFLLTSCISIFSENTSSQLVTSIFRREIGVRELTGHNDGVRVETYLASCHLKKGNPWCAAFITWTYRTAGIKAVVSGYAPNWFQGKNIVYMRGSKKNISPEPADVFGIYFPSKKRIAHVGFVDEWKSGSVAITVEGNTNEAGSREGDGVYRKRRLKSQIYKVSRWL
jgi:hypothetical protein